MSLLLTSVFRPFGVDDEYGRKENKLELFHNQVTREQGIFSIRCNHRSFGLYFIAENIEMPTSVIDFPTLKQFRREVKKGYDYVGISFITPNFLKAKRMAEIVRETAPLTKIILGGHGTRIPDIENLIDSDFVFRGEGISQLRELFGEDPEAPIKHPVMPSSDNWRVLGLPVSQTSAVLIPGVGCPNACRFCCTSHFFDKTYFPFLKTGREIFDTLVYLSDSMRTNEFQVMDENFLKQKERAFELLEIMERERRTFSFNIFSSAEAIIDFGVENMVRLGVTYVWIGSESKQSLFEKTKDVDMKELISELRANGIVVLASSILFLEHHDRETLQEDIDYAIDLKPDFTQFMQLGPMPQTKLYLDYKKEGRLLEDIPYEEWHGQHRLWFRHPQFTGAESETLLREAFRKEFETLGPSVLRVCETMVRGMDSPAYKTSDPFMLLRHKLLKKKCREYFYALKAMKWLLPSKQMKGQAGRIEKLYMKHFKWQRPLNWLVSGALCLLAGIARVKLGLGYEAHQPGTRRTMFRLPPAAYRDMRGRIRAIFKKRRTWAILDNTGGTAALSLHFSGKTSRRTFDALTKRLSSRPHFSFESVRINITQLADFNEETFERFLEKLSHRCEDIRIYCSEIQKRHLAFFNRLMSEQVCSVSTY